MRLPSPSADWPESWRLSHRYDVLGLDPGYGQLAYANTQRLLLEHTLDLVRGAAAEGARILDVGAGEGTATLLLAERGYHVTWNDIRADLAGYVGLKYERGQVRYAPGDVFELRFDGEFDLVLAAELIEHVAHPDRLLCRIAGFLRPGGALVLTTPSADYMLNRLPRYSDIADPAALEPRQFQPDAEGHLFLLSASELHRLASAAGFSLVVQRTFGNPLSSGHLKTRHLLPFVPRSVVRALEAASQLLPAPLRRAAHAHSASLFRLEARVARLSTRPALSV